ncbi:MAG: hypothetical protein K2P81_08735 [Bacteriovoracaceae bacterium]|nr:hypothetical protein [Bacteriovoracaceae bacterium]
MKKLFCLILLSLTFSVGAVIEAPIAFPDSRQNPSGLEWKQVSSDHFNVIFPEGTEAEAQEVLSSLESLYAPIAEGLKVSPAPLTVILQAHTLQSNGFVTLAPRRSEFFIIPWMGPEISQTDWLKALSVHEFRHVAQFDKSRTGFAKALRIVLGQTGTALAIGLTLPAWYLEGDAVGTETALSSAGRGRQPFFERDWRALILDNQEWSYDQLSLGSYTRWRPNHYVYGYFLTTYLRRHFGREVLERIHFETMERAYNPLAFYNAIERVTGQSIDTVYKKAVRELKAKWSEQQEKITSVAPSPVFMNQSEEWINYSYPSALNEGVFSYRESLGHIGQFVKMTSKGEEILWTPSPLLQDFPFKVRAGLVATSEVEVDPRWGIQDYSRVRIHEASSGEVVFQKNKTKWLLPVVNHEGSELAVIDWQTKGEPQFKIIDIKSGKINFKLPWPRANAVLGLDWVQGEESLVVLYREGVYQLTLAKIDLKTGSRQILGQTEKWNWAYPSADKDYVYFQSPQSGIDNIHRISFRDHVEERVTDEKVGAYHPQIHNGELYYSRYTARGLKPVKVLSSELKFPLTGSGSIEYYSPLVEQEGKGDLLSKIVTTDSKVEDYSLTKSAFNPHSWVLLAPPFTSSVTAQLTSTDVLNTTHWVNGVQWNLNERALQGFTSLRWSYLWPIFDIGAAFGSRREKLSGKSEDSWQEASTQVGMTLPWSSFHGAWLLNSSLRGSGQMLHANGRVNPPRGELSTNTLAAAGVEGSWSFLRRQSARDLLPSWGVSTNAKLLSAAETQRSAKDSHQLYGSLKLFAPGLFEHHHLYGELASETQRAAGYHFLSPIFFARGFPGKFMEEQTKNSLNYTFPLFYPEWAPGKYFYLKRVAFNAFYDHSFGRQYGDKRSYESRGAELWFDSNFVRNAFGFQWGLRWNAPVSREQNFDIFLNTGIASW